MTNYSRNYYSHLIGLSQKLSKADLNNLVFSCGDVLPASSAEKITTGTDLFRELKQRGHVGLTNYDFLRQKLVLVGRKDLASTLPDQFEILFGHERITDQNYLGYVVSPSAPPPAVPMNLWFCQSNAESRMFLMYLSEQLNTEEVRKLAFLMYPHNGCLTTLKLVELLDSEGGISSMRAIEHMSTCLEAVGRVDLANMLDAVKIPEVLVPSLSTTQQQLDLKIRLLFHAKQQSYDFHMRALSKVTSNSEERMMLLKPLSKRLYTSFEYTRIFLHAQTLHEALLNGGSSRSDNFVVDFDSLLRTSLQEALKINKAYVMRTNYLESCIEVNKEVLHEMTKEVHEAYKSFDVLMDSLTWNPEVREELKETLKLQKMPFGSHANSACHYIFELSQEVCRCSKIHQEKQITDKHLHTLNTGYYCCCYHFVVLQWFASLLCLFTSFNCAHINIRKHKEMLLNIIQQKKEDISKSSHHISKIVGHDTYQKLTPLLQSAGVLKLSENDIHLAEPQPNPLLLLFDVFLIELLAVAVLGPNTITARKTYLVDSHLRYLNTSSHMLMIVAMALKKQVEAFREKALSEDQLCSHLISVLTINDD